MVAMNSNLGKDGKPIGPLHFYPHHNPELVPKPKPKLTPEQIAAQIDAQIFNLKPRANT